MRYRDRATVCVSSQAGCAMGCTFCATGQAGFERHLDAGEIVEQVVRAQHALAAARRQRRVHGHGRAARQRRRGARRAARACTTTSGFSARHLTVSTVGVVPGMHRLARVPAAGHARGLAPRARRRAARAELVPLNRRYPIAAVLDAARAYARGEGPPGHVRVRVHRGRERPPAPGRRLAGRLARVPWRRAREPHPAQPDRRLRGRAGRRPSASPRSRPGCASAGVNATHPPQPGHRHRRRVRPAPGPRTGRAEPSPPPSARMDP